MGGEGGKYLEKNFFAEEKKNKDEKGGRNCIEGRIEQVKENIGRRENYFFKEKKNEKRKYLKKERKL